MILDFHASHPTEEIIKHAWKSMHFKDSWLPTLPTPPKKSWKMYETPCISHDSGLPTPLKKSFKMYGNL